MPAPAVGYLDIVPPGDFLLNPTYVDTAVLAAGVPQWFTVPTSPQAAKKVIFSGSANFFAKFFDADDVNIAVNGTFASDTVWVKGTGWTIGAGVATAAGAISTTLLETPTIPIIQGQAYWVTYDVTVTAGNVTFNVGGTAGTARASTGSYTEMIIAGAGTTLGFTGAGFTGTVDNVTVTPAASIPTTSQTAGTGSEQNPNNRHLQPGTTTIGLISATAAVVTLSYFA